MNNSHTSFSLFLQMIIKYSCILFAFLMPFFVLPVPWASIAQSKTLLATTLIIIGIIAWLVSSVMDRRVILLKHVLVIGTLLLVLAYTFSAYAAGGPLYAFVSGEALQDTLASILLFFGAVVFGVISTEHRASALHALIALCVSGILVVMAQIGHLLLPTQLSFFGVLSGSTSTFIGSWHDLGIFAGLLLILSCGLLEARVSENRALLVVLQALAVLSFVQVVIMNLVDVWLAIFGASLVFACARMIRTYKKNRTITSSARSALLWIALALVALGASFATTFISSHLPSPLQVTLVEVRPSWEGTIIAGQRLYEGGKALVFGSGPNTFDREWALFHPREVNTTNFWNIEFQSGYGVVPTSFVTVGLAGTLAWIFLALALLWTGYKAMRAEQEGRLRLVLFVACLFLLLYHFIYVPQIGISLILFLLLGLLAGISAGSTLVMPLEPRPAPILVFLLTLGVSCGIIAGGLLESRMIVSTLYTARAASLYQSTGNVEQSADLVARAIKIDPKNDIAQRAAVEIGLLQLGVLAASKESDETIRAKLQSTLSTTISHGLEAVSIDNSSYQNWLALAGLYQSLAGVGIQGAYEQAQAAWLKAASTTPANPYPYLQLGRIAMVQSQNPEAKAYFAKAIELKQDLALPYFLRAQILAGEKAYQAAIQDAATAAQLAPQDPLGWYTLGIILYSAEDFTNAGIALEKAVALQPNYADALFALGIVYDKVGVHANALSAIQKVNELNSGNQLVERVLLNLQSGKPALDGFTGDGAAPGTSAKKK